MEGKESPENGPTGAHHGPNVHERVEEECITEQGNVQTHRKFLYSRMNRKVPKHNATLFWGRIRLLSHPGGVVILLVTL